MERHRRFTLSYPLSCNTGLVFCNDAPLSLQPSLQALSSSVPTPWLMAPSQQTLPITADAPLLTVFEGRYPALIWGVAAEDWAAMTKRPTSRTGEKRWRKSQVALRTHTVVRRRPEELGPSGDKRRARRLCDSQCFKDSSTDKPPSFPPAL